MTDGGGGGAGSSMAGGGERDPGGARRPPIPLLALNGALAGATHDPGVRRAMELMCRGSPILRTGSACDLACTYCCVGADGRPLEDEQVLRGHLDALAGLGFRGVGYMGGEPTLHPAFSEVVGHARARGFTCQMLCTNGLRLGEGAYAERVFAAGVNAVTTSLDAFDAAVQEPLYGGRGSHAQALAGLRHALEAPGVEVLVSAVVTALNAAALPQYMEEVAALQQRHGKPIGAMLCALQRPARARPDQAALTLGIIDSARLVAAALGRAREVGVAAFTFGLPPCLLPGHEVHVSELYAAEWVVDSTAGTVERSRLGDRGTHWTACPACPHAWYCPGVMKQYASDEVRAAVSAGRGP